MHFDTKIVTAQDLYDMRFKITPAINQRGQVWTVEKQKLLIESKQRGIDIPKLYFFQESEDAFEVVDGNQRFRALVNFFEDEYPTLQGTLFSQLSATDEKPQLENFKFTLVLITEASQEDLADLFLRLQLGVTTNTGEKLNAILGPMRDFVKDLAKMPFIAHVSIPSRRFAREVVCACVCLNSFAPFRKGFRDTRYEDLKEMYESGHDFDKESPEAQRIVKTLTELNRIFGLDAVKIRNRASIISIYFLVEELDLNGALNDEAVHDFYIKFLEELKHQVELGLEFTNKTLVNYYNKVVGGADVRGTITARHQILMHLYKIWLETGTIGS